MNLVTVKVGRSLVVLAAWAASACLVVGCSNLPSPQQLAEFHSAGPIQIPVDEDALVRAKIPAGPYRVVPGDVLAIRIWPPVRTEVTEAPIESMYRRVTSEGKITLPLVDEISVGGKTFVEIESALVKAYHPQYVVTWPAVVVQVAEYSTRYVEVVGGVAAPGVYQLRSDEMTLVCLLMKAGNIVPQGAVAIHVTQPGEKEAKTLALPVRGLNMPFADVPLAGGEIVEVERMNPQTVTVFGLVRAPGTYPFAPDARMGLAAALGLAGGTDPVADPRYATVYRQDADGKLVSARFQLNDGNSFLRDASLFADSSLGKGAFVALKPGDVIFVEKDARTRTRTIFAKIVGVQVGASAQARTEATYYKDYSGGGGVKVRE